MYQSAHIVGEREFQKQERIRRLIENQDDHEERLLKLGQRAEDVDGRYGDAIWRTDKAASIMGSAPTMADYAALSTRVSRQGQALALLVLVNIVVALVAVLR
jgi:hypothetical protein